MYGWTNEDGEPIMSGEAYRFEQQLDEDSRADHYADRFYDQDPYDEGEEDEPMTRRFACENHDEPGQCTEECANLLNMMSPPPSQDFDETGTTYHPDQPYEVATYDPATRGTYLVTIDPEEER